MIIIIKFSTLLSKRTENYCELGWVVEKNREVEKKVVPSGTSTNPHFFLIFFPITRDPPQNIWTFCFFRARFSARGNPVEEHRPRANIH